MLTPSSQTWTWQGLAFRVEEWPDSSSSYPSGYMCMIYAWTSSSYHYFILAETSGSSSSWKDYDYSWDYEPGELYTIEATADGDELTC